MVNVLAPKAQTVSSSGAGAGAGTGVDLGFVNVLCACCPLLRPFCFSDGSSSTASSPDLRCRKGAISVVLIDAIYCLQG